MKVYQTKHFYIGFKHPVTPTKNGTIYLNGQDFAGTWYEDPKHGWIKTPGYALNRHGLAIDMGLPVHAHFETLEALLAYLEGWYEETQSKEEEYAQTDT